MPSLGRHQADGRADAVVNFKQKTHPTPVTPAPILGSDVPAGVRYSYNNSQRMKAATITAIDSYS